MPRGLHFFCLLGVASTSPCRAWLCHRICTAWPWEACWIVDISSGLRQPNFTGIEKQDLATWGLVETPELRSRRFTSIFANIDVWQKLQPKLGWRNFASIIEKLDFQRLLQSELGWCSFTSIFAKFDFWCWLQPKLERLPASAEIDIWPGFQSELGSRGFTSIFANTWPFGYCFNMFQPKLG